MTNAERIQETNAELRECVEIAENLPNAGAQFTTDETLTLEDGVLSVNTAKEVEQDNTLPITSAAVYTTVGNISALLDTI